MFITLLYFNAFHCFFLLRAEWRWICDLNSRKPTAENWSMLHQCNFNAIFAVHRYQMAIDGLKLWNSIIFNYNSKKPLCDSIDNKKCNENCIKAINRLELLCIASKWKKKLFEQQNAFSIGFNYYKNQLFFISNVKFFVLICGIDFHAPPEHYYIIHTLDQLCLFFSL